MAEDPTNVASADDANAKTDEGGSGEAGAGKAEGSAGAPAFDSSKLPPDLRGKSAEEIATLWNQRNDAVSTLARDVEDLKKRQREAGRQPAPAPKADDKPPTPEEFFADPVGATERLMGRRIEAERAPLEATNIDLTEKVALIDARQKFEDFAELEPEIEAYIAQEEDSKGLRVLRTPDSLEKIYYIVQGRKALADRRAKSAAISAEKPSPPKNEKAKPSLTDEEKSIARKMRMTPEEYQSYAEESEFDVRGAQPEGARR